MVQRVLSGSDLTARDNQGQTVLHVAVSTNQSDSVVKTVLNNGIDIAARDCQGRTARDLAEKLNRPKYVKLIDEHVIKLLKDKKFEPIERLILHNYDHLLDISDGAKTLVDIAKKSSSRNIYEVVKLTAPIQVSDLFRLLMFYFVASGCGVFIPSCLKFSSCVSSVLSSFLIYPI